MKTETLHPVTDYISELFNSLVGSEGFRGGLPYFDTATPAKATIGYGFNMEVSNYLLLVLEQLGIVNDTMTTTEINARRDAFITAINNTPDTGNIDTIDAQLQTNLNQVASSYGVSSFRLNFDATLGYSPQGYTIFREIIEGTTVGSIPIQGKQERLDALLQNSLDHNSKEYVAVVSLFYNSEALVNSQRRLLANAIINDNRAEAWFEIRYGSNADGQHATRRYAEADLFGLYDTAGTTTDAEAKEIMRMYTRHQTQETDATKTIQYYEGRYSPSASGTNTITNNILPAYNYLITNYAPGATINNVIVGPEPGGYLGNGPILTGGTGNDLIIGGAGNDKITGGTGNDTVYAGDGNDRIFGGTGDDTLSGDNNYSYITDGKDYIEGNDGDDIIAGGYEDDILIGGAGNDIIAGEYLGGYDAYTQRDPAKNTGASNDDYIDGGDGNDVLVGGLGNDTIIGGAGDDQIDGDLYTTASSGTIPPENIGNDIIDAGAGSDIVYGYGGNDIIFGGTGSAADNDIIDGGDG
ncbi:MAG: hypothetical protein HY026_11165, partial [Deltaproteobacteria bacterium]|nr:hypothetical protein [Deltaproteobacteria bacterium]